MPESKPETLTITFRCLACEKEQEHTEPPSAVDGFVPFTPVGPPPGWELFTGWSQSETHGLVRYVVVHFCSNDCLLGKTKNWNAIFEDLVYL